MSINFIGLSGRLTADPVLNTTTSGISVCNARIAVERVSKGEKTTDFFTLRLFKNTAETLCRYCRKGDKITVVGSLQMRSYETKNGEKRTEPEIVVNALDLPPKQTGAELRSKPEIDSPSMEDVLGTDDFPFN